MAAERAAAKTLCTSGLESCYCKNGARAVSIRSATRGEFDPQLMTYIVAPMLVVVRTPGRTKPLERYDEDDNVLATFCSGGDAADKLSEMVNGKQAAGQSVEEFRTSIS